MKITPMKVFRLSCLIFIFGVLQFLLLTFLAAFHYPGGYDYFGYFFSDLGATVARNGEPNSTSSILFSIALIILALTFFPFWMVVRSPFKESQFGLLSQFGSAFGVMSCPFMIGIALLPFDTMLSAHIVATFLFILFSCIACLLFSIAVILHPNCPTQSGLIGIVLFMVTLVTFAVSLAPSLVSIGAFLQKTVFYGYCVWAFSQIRLVGR